MEIPRNLRAIFAAQLMNRPANYSVGHMLRIDSRWLSIHPPSGKMDTIPTGVVHVSFIKLVAGK